MADRNDELAQRRMEKSIADAVRSLVANHPDADEEQILEIVREHIATLSDDQREYLALAGLKRIINEEQHKREGGE